MEERKARRFEHQRIQEYRICFQTLDQIVSEFRRDNYPEGAIFPKIIDICGFQSVRFLIDSSLQTFNELQFRTQLLRLLPRICIQWREDIDSLVREMIKDQVGCSADASLLDLTRAAFHCHCCTTTLIYPAVLVHECLNPTTSDRTRNEALNGARKAFTVYDKAAQATLGRHPLALDALDFDAARGSIECVEI